MSSDFSQLQDPQIRAQLSEMLAQNFPNPQESDITEIFGGGVQDAGELFQRATPIPSPGFVRNINPAAAQVTPLRPSEPFDFESIIASLAAGIGGATVGNGTTEAVTDIDSGAGGVGDVADVAAGETQVPTVPAAPAPQPVPAPAPIPAPVTPPPPVPTAPGVTIDLPTNILSNIIGAPTVGTEDITAPGGITVPGPVSTPGAGAVTSPGVSLNLPPFNPLADPITGGIPVFGAPGSGGGGGGIVSDPSLFNPSPRDDLFNPLGFPNQPGPFGPQAILSPTGGDIQALLSPIPTEGAIENAISAGTSVAQGAGQLAGAVGSWFQAASDLGVFSEGGSLFQNTEFQDLLRTGKQAEAIELLKKAVEEAQKT